MRVRLLFFIAAIGVASCKTAGEVEEHKKIESGSVLGVRNGFVFRLYTDVPLNFTEAAKSCVSKKGRLLVVTDKETDDVIGGAVLDIQRYYDGLYAPFWMGLHYADGHWQYEGETPAEWHGENPPYTNWMSDDEFDLKHEPCVGYRGDKWKKIKCFATQNYICMEPVKMCSPPGATTDLEKPSPALESTCTSRVGKIRARRDCNCNPGEVGVQQSHTYVCNATHFWELIACLPVCLMEASQTPMHATLLGKTRFPYPGSLVRYYCPGYFIVDGKETLHHTAIIPCHNTSYFTERVGKLRCQPKDTRNNSDALMKHVVLHAVTDHDYALRCDHERSAHDVDDHVWFYKGKLIKNNTHYGDTSYRRDPNDRNLLVVEHVSQESTGVYSCYGRKFYTYFPGKTYNITLEHSDQAEQSLQNWNNVADQLFLGEFEQDKTVFSHVAYRQDKVMFSQANSFCAQKNPPGELASLMSNQSVALLTKLYSIEMLPSFPLKPNSRGIYPNVFWVGLKLDPAKNKWLDMKGAVAPEKLPWDTEHRSYKRNDLLCAAVFLAEGTPKLIKADCNSKHHFICTFPSEMCVPTGVAPAESYKCLPEIVNKSTTIANDCECPGESDLTSKHKGLLSCGADKKWVTSTCVETCDEYKEYGRLVNPDDEEFYVGMYMNYFCPGHFLVNGFQYHQNSLQLMCDPNREKAQVSIICKYDENKLVKENYAVKVVALVMNGVRGRLECVRGEVNPTRTVWVHMQKTSEGNRFLSVLHSPSRFYSLAYNSRDDLGVYMCFFELNNILLPGQVFNVVEKTVAPPKKEPTSAAGHSLIPLIGHGSHLLLLLLSVFLLC